MSTFIAAIAQMNSQQDKSENLKAAAGFAAEAGARGARLLAFPECMEYCGPDTSKAAEPIPGGETSELMAELAKKYGMWILCTIHEKVDGVEKPYNTTFVTDPNGEVVSTYRKIHLSDMRFVGASLESDRVSSGDKLVTFDAGELGVWGLSICYDMRFGEMYRLMALQGANLLFVPASFYQKTGMDHWEPILRTRAIENNCYLLAPAQCGKKPNYPSYGKSMIIDPWGNVLGCASERPGLVTAEIDLDYISVARDQTSTFFNRREDCYTLEINKG